MSSFDFSFTVFSTRLKMRKQKVKKTKHLSNYAYINAWQHIKSCFITIVYVEKKELQHCKEQIYNMVQFHFTILFFGAHFQSNQFNVVVVVIIILFIWWRERLSVIQRLKYSLCKMTLTNVIWMLDVQYVNISSRCTNACAHTHTQTF